MRDLVKWNRGYLCDLVYSVCGERFKSWRDKRIKDRNDILTDKESLGISMDPELEQAFRASTMIASK